MGLFARNHRLGETIAEARRDRGLTQRQLADLCGYSQSTISRLERGLQSVHDVRMLALVADRLGIAHERVGLSSEGASTQNERVNRRHFLGASAALGMPALPDDIATAHRAVNPAVVDHLRRLRATLVQSDSLYGPRSVIGTVQDHLKVLAQQLLPATTGRLRRALLQTSAEWAEFAGWLHEDLGQPERSLWWSDRAMEWAQEADDPARQSFILMRKAQQSANLSQPQRTLGLAAAALRVRGDVAQRVRASAHLQLAHGHAWGGDQTETARALDAAREMVDDGETPTDGLGGYCVPAYVEIQRASCLLRLGKPAEAVTVYERALGTWPSQYERERGLHLARFANAHAANRDPDEACAVGGQALEIIRETASRRTKAELQRVVTGLAPWRRMSAVRDLTEAVSVL
ncbi:helix-turn-helix domain-containing protein [Streptomyces sp. NBC_01803]|uniref:helix-turn-helix domain-containing protein n=1 Tax=Streptomyces sp. NBC_01803 TaxID=2975946 RepID=UPI002DDAA995|nr:helix-turn-helix transcriptional regulator [Streptomyces sp. NBC_01803]WSA44944.1 helix-turn-helix domain-containing protein [Streptomyces sp. NBC_01803]